MTFCLSLPWTLIRDHCFFSNCLLKMSKKKWRAGLQFGPESSELNGGRKWTNGKVCFGPWPHIIWKCVFQYSVVIFINLSNGPIPNGIRFELVGLQTGISSILGIWLQRAVGLNCGPCTMDCWKWILGQKVSFCHDEVVPGVRLALNWAEMYVEQPLNNKCEDAWKESLKSNLG